MRLLFSTVAWMLSSLNALIDKNLSPTFLRHKTFGSLRRTPSCFLLPTPSIREWTPPALSSFTLLLSPRVASSSSNVPTLQKVLYTWAYVMRRANIKYGSFCFVRVSNKRAPNCGFNNLQCALYAVGATSLLSIVFYILSHSFSANAKRGWATLWCPFLVGLFEPRLEVFSVWVLLTLIGFMFAFIAMRTHDWCKLKLFKAFRLADAAFAVNFAWSPAISDFFFSSDSFKKQTVTVFQIVFSSSKIWMAAPAALYILFDGRQQNRHMHELIRWLPCVFQLLKNCFELRTWSHMDSKYLVMLNSAVNKLGFLLFVLLAYLAQSLARISKGNLKYFCATS